MSEPFILVSVAEYQKLSHSPKTTSSQEQLQQKVPETTVNPEPSFTTEPAPLPDPSPALVSTEPAPLPAPSPPPAPPAESDELPKEKKKAKKLAAVKITKKTKKIGVKSVATKFDPSKRARSNALEKMALTVDQEKLLEQLYYHSNVAFRGVNSLYEAAKVRDGKLNLKNVKNWLRGQKTYTFHKPARRNYKRNKINAQFVGEIMQFDLADMLPHERDSATDQTYKYLFVAIDSYSRFGFGVPITGRQSKNITDAMTEIIHSGYKPDMAMADPAGENLSAKTKKYFKDQGIHLYTTSSLKHAPQAERLIRDLRIFVRRYSTANNTNKWLEAAKQFIHNHNNVVCRSTGEKPIDIINDDEADWRAFENLYKTHIKRPNPKRVTNGPDKGSVVRLSRIKMPFEKESTHRGNWSKELFTVQKVDKHDTKPMYQLNDWQDNPIKGKAYDEEIQEVEKPTDESLFEVEKIVSKKRIRGVLHYRIKWLGYPSRMNTWVPATDVQALTEDQRDLNVL